MNVHEVITELQKLEVEFGREITVHICDPKEKPLMGKNVHAIGPVKNPRGEPMSITLFSDGVC